MHITEVSKIFFCHIYGVHCDISTHIRHAPIKLGYLVLGMWTVGRKLARYTLGSEGLTISTTKNNKQEKVSLRLH